MVVAVGVDGCAATVTMCRGICSRRRRVMSMRSGGKALGMALSQSAACGFACECSTAGQEVENENG